MRTREKARIVRLFVKGTPVDILAEPQSGWNERLYIEAIIREALNGAPWWKKQCRPK